MDNGNQTKTKTTGFLKAFFKNLRGNFSRLLAILIALLSLIAVLMLMNHVRSLLYSDVQINLTEIVTQNKDVITSKLKVEVNNLGLTANQLADLLKNESQLDDAAVADAARRYFANHEGNGKYFIASKDGVAYFENGRALDISGRKYFRLALEGSQNISDRTVSRLTGDDIFVISVPLTVRGAVVGTVQRQYSPEEMYNLCSISLFSSQGYLYVINREGYILISSRNEVYSQEAENYFRLLYAQGNQDAARRLESDVKNNRAGFMETEISGEKTFSAYTPIEELHDWYLISSVATTAVSPNANIVINMFYAILIAVVILFALSLLYFISYKNKQQSNLERIAFVDNITKGNTFNKFLVELHRLLADNPAKPLYLLKFDIDNFKYVNNFYGFDFGDRVLFEINRSVQEKLRPGEFLARISSDHFVVLLEDAEEERLSALFAAISKQEGLLLYFSSGLYPITDRSESVDLMVDKASTAAQTAKGSLMKKVIPYTEKFDQMMMRNEQLKRAVKQALTGGEMIPFYQPKVDVNTGELVGAEALVRWKTQDGKLVPPNEFIPLCEKTGLITELDMVVFEQVLQFLRKCLNDKIRCVPISVNFSRLHLPDDTFLDKVVSLLRQYGISPDLVELELTESAMFDNHELIFDFIKRLHEKDLKISMDDFGSGYSSLNMLKDIPIDVLKIDRDFLKETGDNERRDIIFSTIAQMAQHLKIRVVVEGVETLENVELMKRFGCFVAQGYYFAKPMDENTFDTVIRKGIV